MVPVAKDPTAVTDVDRTTLLLKLTAQSKNKFKEDKKDGKTPFTPMLKKGSSTICNDDEEVETYALPR
jgi:hypothetical protein